MKKKFFVIVVILAMVLTPVGNLTDLDLIGTDTVSAATTKDFSKKRPVIKNVVTVNDTYIKVSWGKVIGATGYRIYRSDSKDGAYKQVAKVGAGVTSYTNKNVKENKKYYYKVRAYKKKKYSKYSTPKWGIVRVNPMDQIMADANKKHTAWNTSQNAFSNMEKYTPKSDGTFNLLTDAEVDSLYQDHARKNVSAEEAKKDINLYFRTLKCAYGAYYYFGADKFEHAEKEMLAWAEKQKSVSADSLSKELTKQISFVEDAHFWAGDAWHDETANRFYHYYYCLKSSYEKDENGYFTYLDGSKDKWYVQSFSDRRVSLKPTLRTNGAMVYAPTLLCTENTKNNCTIKLKNKKGTVKTETVSLVKNEPFNKRGISYFKKAEDKGLAYISIRSFIHEEDNGYADFERSGKELKNAKAIIFDIRANEGGSDEFGRHWVKNFTGRDVQENQFFALKKSKFSMRNNGGHFNSGGFDPRVFAGKMLPNDVPIIVLVDNQCGSSGESMLNYLRSMKNVLIVGTNSAGYQLCGNIHGYSLPHTGMPFDFGTSLSLYFDDENVDYKGYEPDVWCSSDRALDATLAMFAREAPERDFSAFAAAVKETLPKYDIKLRMGKNIISPNNGFGTGETHTTLEVLVNGKVTEDYNLSTDSDDVIICKKRGDGKIDVTGVGHGDCYITIECGNEKATFRYHR